MELAVIDDPMAMEFEHKATISQAHPETMDFLSRTWCNFAVQAFQPPAADDYNALLLHGDDQYYSSLQKVDTDRILPPWKSNDVKSWLWMQQAMHPELKYDRYSYFKKKWMQKMFVSPIKKWLKDIKQRSKEGKRLQRAEVHAAVSVAGLAAALAAIAAEKESSCAVASAAAVVAAQCARVAEAMGANKEQLHIAISSATTTATEAGTNDDHILTLTAAATTSLRGATALKVREGNRNNNSNLNHQAVPVIEDNNDYTFSFGKCRLLLAKGAKLKVETPDGSCGLMFVSVACSKEAKVVLTIKKPDLFNAFSMPQKSVVVDLKAELYRELDNEEMDISYVIILTTNNGIMKLDMMDDYRRYKTWSTTITHMLMLST